MQVSAEVISNRYLYLGSISAVSHYYHLLAAAQVVDLLSSDQSVVYSLTLGMMITPDTMACV